MLTPSSSSGGTGPDTPTVGMVGTLAYMSPEQAEARWDLVGPASDVFSLGAILYAILTGRAPYQGGTAGEVLERVKRCEFPRPRQVKPEVSRGVGGGVPEGDGAGAGGSVCDGDWSWQRT